MPTPAKSMASPGTASPTASATCVADPSAVTAYTLPDTAKGPPPNAENLAAAAVKGFAQTAAHGAVVGVLSPKGTWTQAFGVADPSTNEPMATDIYQRIGSVTKTFTGTLLLQLDEKGKLDLEDPISKYEPDVPNGANITLRMLADMTSGLASYTLDSRFQSQLFGTPEKTWTPDELLAIGLALPPLFPPGEQFDYSNTNTVLLGKVIEKVTGETFPQVLQQQILDPLKLAHTSMPGADEPFPSPHAQGFTLQGTSGEDLTQTNTTNWNPTWAWTAGQIVSTAQDLLVYGRALGTGQGLLTPATQIERLTSMPQPAGYGLAGGCIDGWFGHAGEMPGYNTSVFYDTGTDTTVVVLVNSDVPTGNCTESKTPQDNPKELPCMDPATRIFVAVSAVLGHEFTPNPKK